MINILARFRRLAARSGNLSRRVVRDRRGGVAVFLAFAIIPMIGFIGIGTDTARAYLVKSRLSSALDSAGLAGGWSFHTENREADIMMFFNANFPPGFMGATVSGPAVTVNEAEEKLVLTASASVPTSFMTLFGIDDVTVAADAEVTRRMTALDAVIAIDMSGSMGSSAGGGLGSRIEAARAAAADLVDILFGGEAEKDYLNIGLVPWNAKVNVTIDGTVYDASDTTTQPVAAFLNPETGINQTEVYFAGNSPVPLLAPPHPDWQGCVFNRFIDDGAPDSDADILLGPVSLAGADWPAWQPIGPEGEPVPGYTDCDMAVSGSECGSCLNHGITPLQNVKSVILDRIDDLQYPTGTTNITQGLGWAWRVLKPDPPFTEAVPDPEFDRQQAIVLLTDGENVAGSGDGYKATWGLGGGAQDEMDDRLRLLADNLKANGVIVYVIQFANDGTDLQTLLKEVASGPDAPYYHYAPDGDALQIVFREVANHLSQLRLSK